MIVSMPPLRIYWASASAFEIDHGVMDMPREGQTIVRSAAYPLSGAPDGVAEVHIEHWVASNTTFSEVGKTDIGWGDGNTNGDRSGFISWLASNGSLAVQYAHRRVFRLDNVGGTNSKNEIVVPDPYVGGTDVIEVTRGSTLFATAHRRSTSSGALVVWKLSGDLTDGETFDFNVVASAASLTTAEFLENKSGDPGHLSTVAHAYYEEIADFPGGPGTSGSNVPLD